MPHHELAFLTAVERRGELVKQVTLRRAARRSRNLTGRPLGLQIIGNRHAGLLVLHASRAGEQIQPRGIGDLKPHVDRFQFLCRPFLCRSKVRDELAKECRQGNEASDAAGGVCLKVFTSLRKKERPDTARMSGRFQNSSHRRLACDDVDIQHRRAACATFELQLFFTL